MTRVKLVALEGYAPGTEHTLGTTPVTFGRAPTCSVVLDDDDVSREHCRIRPSGDGYVLEDLGSRNGTVVNGRRIEQAVPLHPGDLVVVGRALFEVRASGAPVTPVRPSPAAPARPTPAASSAARQAPVWPSPRPRSPRASVPSAHAPPASRSTPSRRRAPARAAAPSTVAVAAEEAAATGRRVLGRVTRLAGHTAELDPALGGLAPVHGRAARSRDAAEARRLLVVCRRAAGRRGASLTETLGAEVASLQRIVGAAVALCEAIRAG